MAGAIARAGDVPERGRQARRHRACRSTASAGTSGRARRRPTSWPRTRRLLRATHRALRPAALHVREQLPGRQGELLRTRAVERVQADRGRASPRPRRPRCSTTRPPRLPSDLEPLSRRIAGAILASVALFSTGCRTPFHLSDEHVTTGPQSPSLDISVLACAPVAALGVAAPGALRGLRRPHRLARALHRAAANVAADPGHPDAGGAEPGLSTRDWPGSTPSSSRATVAAVSRIERDSSGSAPPSALDTCCNRGSPSSPRPCSTSSSSGA